MHTHRRGFLQILGGALTFALGQGSCAREPPSAWQVHRSTRNTRGGAIGARLRRQLSSEEASPFKSYPGVERLALSSTSGDPTLPLAVVVRSDATLPGSSDEPLDRTELGRLLHLTNGMTGQRGDTLLRAAPSAGALYAGEVYVIVERVKGVSPGAYYYSVADHALLRIRTGSLANGLARAVESADLIEGASAIILLSNVFNRYGRRYANRGYRYAFIDTGHIGENLRLSARSLGLGERGFLRFHDDRINALLELDGLTESVCALHAVGKWGTDGSDATRGWSFVEKRTSAEDLPGVGTVQRYQEASKLIETGAKNESRLPDGSPTARTTPLTPHTTGPGTTLPPSQAFAPSGSVQAMIRQRRSTVRFSDEPITQTDLGFVLEAAAGRSWLRRAPGVDLLLVVHRVADLAPGLYDYEPQRHRVGLVRGADLRESMVAACLGQERAGTAAAGVLMVGRVGQQARRAGGRSYRDLLIESGAIGQRVYLAAEASGLTARNLAAFLDDQLNALLGLDGVERATLHLTMLGRGN